MFGAASAVLMPPNDMLRWMQREDSIEERLKLVFSGGKFVAQLSADLERAEERLSRATGRDETLSKKVTSQETMIGELTTERDGLRSDLDSSERKLQVARKGLATAQGRLVYLQREMAERALPSAHVVTLTQNARESFYDRHVQLELVRIVSSDVCSVRIYSEAVGVARELPMRSGLAHIFRAMGRQYYLVMLEKDSVSCTFELFPRQVGPSFR